MKRLNIYFIHSKKFDYENLIYKKVLSSSVCLNQNIILPYSKNNQTTYTKDLMEKADLISVDLYKPSLGLTLELMMLSKLPDKKVLYLSQDNVLPKKYQKYVKEFTKHNGNYLELIENFINEEINRLSKIHDGIYTLGEI